MEDIEASMKIRSVKRIYERFKKKAEEFPRVNQALKDSDTYLELVISDLNNEYQVAHSSHDVILGHYDDDDEEFRRYMDSDDFNKLQNIYYEHLTELQVLLKKISISDTQFSSSPYGTASSTQRRTYTFSISNNQHNDFLALSLTSLSIPEFNGEYDKWAEFRDSMRTFVNNNSSFNNSIKLNILLKHLKGEALKVLKKEIILPFLAKITISCGIY